MSTKVHDTFATTDLRDRPRASARSRGILALAALLLPGFLSKFGYRSNWIRSNLAFSTCLAPATAVPALGAAAVPALAATIPALAAAIPALAATIPALATAIPALAAAIPALAATIPALAAVPALATILPALALALVVAAVPATAVPAATTAPASAIPSKGTHHHGHDVHHAFPLTEALLCLRQGVRDVHRTGEILWNVATHVLEDPGCFGHAAHVHEGRRGGLAR